jgi:hypothetical protein
MHLYHSRDFIRQILRQGVSPQTYGWSITVHEFESIMKSFFRSDEDRFGMQRDFQANTITRSSDGRTSSVIDPVRRTWLSRDLISG